MNEQRDTQDIVQMLSELQSENLSLKQTNAWIHDVLAFTGHELRTQLAKLSVFSEQLLRTSSQTPDTHRLEILRSIKQSSTAMNSISQNYLMLAEVETSGFMPCPILVDPIRNILEPLLASYTDFMADKEQTYRIRVTQPGLLLWADPALLMTACENLVNNAIKYGAPKGEIAITLTERGSYDEVSVWNSGPGLPPAIADGVFERFVHGDGNTHEPHAGIGLYLVYRIIEAHGGRLRAESGPGVWANFVFTLPKRESASAVRSERARNH